MDNRVSLMSLGFNKYAATFPGAKGIIMRYLDNATPCKRLQSETEVKITKRLMVWV